MLGPRTRSRFPSRQGWTHNLSKRIKQVDLAAIGLGCPYLGTQGNKNTLGVGKKPARKRKRMNFVKSWSKRCKRPTCMESARTCPWILFLQALFHNGPMTADCRVCGQVHTGASVQCHWAQRSRLSPELRRTPQSLRVLSKTRMGYHSTPNQKRVKSLTTSSWCARQSCVLTAII